MTNGETGYQFEVTPLRNSNIQFLYSRRDEIEMDPPYQRQGEVWSVEKQQLLIDSLINGFDIPKIYLHQYTSLKDSADGKSKRYALIDGKQRINAIFSFLDGNIALSNDFSLLQSGSKKLAGSTFQSLLKNDPLLASDFQATGLDVITIRTDDIELIEEMFSRLNEAVPLNAAEKRNAFGGPLPLLVRKLVEEPFFRCKMPFSNQRYRHFDLAAKFLYWGDSRIEVSDHPTIRDVKKARLDAFFKNAKHEEHREGAFNEKETLSIVKETLDMLTGTFVDKDPLLRNVGMISVYFLLALRRFRAGYSFPDREALVRFDQRSRSQRVVHEDELSNADFVFSEFARHSQSPNDGGALSRRLSIIEAWLNAEEKGESGDEALSSLLKSGSE